MRIPWFLEAEETGREELDQAGQGLEQSGLVEGVPAHVRGGGKR